MKNLLYTLLAMLALVSCSKEEEVVTPPTAKQYTLTISAEAGGTVSTEGGLYNEGSKITVTATPDDMYLFKEWSDGSTQNPREITVTSNLTLKASFIKKTYPLAVTVEGEGTVVEEMIVQGSTTETEYNAGTTVRLTATPNEGWVFAGWSGDVESEELVIEVPIEKGMAVTATFRIPPCYIDYFSLQEGINTKTSHYQPYNIPFIDYASVLDVTLSKYGSYGIFSASGNFNGNDFADYVMVTTDGDNPSSNVVVIVVDGVTKHSFASPQVGNRKISVADLNSDGYDDIVLFGTGPDVGNSSGDKTAIIYMSEEDYEIDIVGQTSGYHHTGAVGAIDGETIDFIEINAQGTFFGDDIGGTVDYYSNSGNKIWVRKETNIPQRWVGTTYQSELVDINGDNILDLILGGHEWTEEWMESNPNPPQWRTHILIGKGDGHFDIENPIILPELTNWGVLTDIDVYDIDNDSELEILITRTTGRRMEQYQPWPETFYDGHIIQALKFDGTAWYQWKLIEQPTEIFSNPDIHIEWPYVTKIYDVNNDCLLDIVPESDKLNAFSFEPLNSVRGLYYEQQEDGSFEIKYNNQE